MSMWIPQICVILFASILFGKIAIRVGQSRVVGEIFAGFILGPTIFGLLFPDAFGWLFSSRSMDFLSALSELGLVLLMFEIPWHAPRLSTLSNQHRAAMLVFGLSVFISLIIGALIGVFSRGDVSPQEPYWTYVFFCGIVLSVSAVPVLVRIINDNKNIGQEIGTIAVSAALYTDVFACFGLTIVLTARADDATSLFFNIGKLLCLMLVVAISLFVVRPAVNVFVKSFKGLNECALAYLALIYCFVSAQITELLGFHQAIGSILAAYVFCNVRNMEVIWRKWIGNFSGMILTPIFFVYAGIQVSLSILSDVILWVWLVMFVIGGLLGKLLGAYISGRILRIDTKSSIELGILLNTKGLIEFVILGMGLQMGVLSNNAYSLLLFFTLISTALTTPLIRVLHARTPKVYNATPPTGV